MSILSQRGSNQRHFRQERQEKDPSTHMAQMRQAMAGLLQAIARGQIQIPPEADQTLQVAIAGAAASLAQEEGVPTGGATAPATPIAEPAGGTQQAASSAGSEATQQTEWAESAWQQAAGSTRGSKDDKWSAYGEGRSTNEKITRACSSLLRYKGRSGTFQPDWNDEWSSEEQLANELHKPIPTVRSALLWPDGRGQFRFAAYIDTTGKLYFGAYKKDALMPKKLQIHKEDTPEASERHDRLLAELFKQGFEQGWLAPKTESEQPHGGPTEHQAGAASGSGDSMPAAGIPDQRTMPIRRSEKDPLPVQMDIKLPEGQTGAATRTGGSEPATSAPAAGPLKEHNEGQ